MQVTGYKRWHLTQQVIMPPQRLIHGFMAVVAGPMATADGAGIIPVPREYKQL